MDGSDIEIEDEVTSLLNRSKAALHSPISRSASPAINKIDVYGNEEEEMETVVLQNLRSENEKLKRKLEVRTAQCKRLSETVESLLAKQSCNTIKVITSTDKPSLSASYFKEQFKAWKSQVWFEKHVSPAVDASYEKLVAKLPNMYVDRTKALTIQECYNMVDELREQWSQDLPPLISKALALGNKVYASKAESREGRNGQTCEAVHFLVYITHKLFNKAAQVLMSLKRKETISTLNENYLHNPLTAKSTATPRTAASLTAERSATKIKWNQNPSMEEEMQKARNSVTKADFKGKDAVEEAIKLTTAKLCGSAQLTIAHALEHIASIVSLKEIASSHGWEIEARNFHHRGIFKYKMLEYWQLYNHEGNWRSYCIKVFGCLNSLICFSFICHGYRAIAGLMAHLLMLSKPIHRKDFQLFMTKLEKGEIVEVEKLFAFLNQVSDIPEYASFYAKAFHQLLDFVVVSRETKSLTETLLLNLLNDLQICSDISKLSNTESADEVKVISILVSLILDPLIKPSKESSAEGKLYADAAIYIARKMKHLLAIDTLTERDERQFWNDPEVEGYNGLVVMCPDITKHVNILPRLKLPKVNVEAKGVGPVLKTTDEMSVKDLRAALMAEGLDTTGNKDALKSRLARTAGYKAAHTDCNDEVERKGDRKRKRLNPP